MVVSETCTVLRVYLAGQKSCEDLTQRTRRVCATRSQVERQASGHADPRFSTEEPATNRTVLDANLSRAQTSRAENEPCRPRWIVCWAAE